ncbi:MAG: hypothetical protein ACLUKN_13535 [Bacilli bacterium]
MIIAPTDTESLLEAIGCGGIGAAEMRGFGAATGEDFEGQKQLWELLRPLEGLLILWSRCLRILASGNWLGLGKGRSVLHYRFGGMWDIVG